MHFDTDEDIKMLRTSKCTGKKKCEYYDVCFPFEKNLPDDSILSLVNSQYKFDLYSEGIKYLSQVDLLKIEGSKQQYAQVMAARNGGFYCDNIGLKNFLDNLQQYPISFVDFEWDLYAVPPYDGMYPVEVLPFEYSLHVLDESGNLTHYQYIGEGDCRKEFIERLISDMPKTGSVVAYNAKGAEVLRLKEIKNAFPEYGEQIDEIIDRVVDLAMPFVSGTAYDVRMRGLYSLKVIQKMIDPENSYNELEVENGLEAIKIYRKLSSCEDKEEKEKYYDELYQYCGLDTYAMIEVFNWLKSKL